MGQAGAGPSGRRIMEFMILVEGWMRLAIDDNSARCVALIHLNAMGVELVLLERDGLAQRLALRGGGGRRVGARLHVFMDLVVIHAAIHAERFKDRPELGDRLVRACHYLAGDWRALG